jgi:hypothetical protein
MIFSSFHALFLPSSRPTRALILGLVLCAPSTVVSVACSGGEASNAVQPAAAGRGNQAAVVPVAVDSHRGRPDREKAASGNHKAVNYWKDSVFYRRNGASG